MLLQVNRVAVLADRIADRGRLRKPGALFCRVIPGLDIFLANGYAIRTQWDFI